MSSQFSLVAKLRTPGEYSFPDDATKLLEFYRALYDATDGAVTPLVGEVLEQAGYDATYSLKPQDNIGEVDEWDNAMKWTGSDVTIKSPVVLDVGAAGKGYLVDMVGEILGSHNIDTYVIDASGDIKSKGDQVERIGLENPNDPTRVLGVAELHDAALCASASNRRSWGKWHHIINPKTGEPARDIVATWVVADSTMLADGLATALFFVPFDRVSKWDFQAIRLFADGHIEQTDNFVGELYI